MENLDLSDALKSQEMRIEHKINTIRVLIFVFLAIVNGIIGTRRFDTAFLTLPLLFLGFIHLLFIAAYYFLVRRVSGKGHYRPWLKYFTITIDYILLVEIFIVKQRIGVLQTDNDMFLFIIIVILFNFLSALRHGKSIIIYSTFAAAVANWLILGHSQADSFIRNYILVMTLLSGGLIIVLSINFNSLFILLRKKEKERFQLRRSLELAKEVQQNFLPEKNPEIDGIDVAGKTIYCDETGGDYFDFIESHDSGEEKITITIGDVAGHGIPAALLMANAYALLRLRSNLPGSISDVVSDVNTQLTKDVKESGRFMTLFYLVIDVRDKSLKWIRAGHDPAIVYDPAQDRFEELKGVGTAIGIDEEVTFEENTRADLKKGQLIILATDGVWESRDAQGNMFGKDRIYEIIRQHAHQSSQVILGTLIDALNNHIQESKSEDDVTLVVIKFTR